MQPEIVAALIAAVVSITASAVTLFIGSRNIRNEREKLQIEREKTQADRERYQSELRESARQAQVWNAEIAKLKAETEKLAIEADDIRRRRFEAERDEIRNLLMFFDRAVFDAPMYSEDPVEMFTAIRQTRISLQTNGASLVRDKEVAEHFQRIREILLNAEAEVLRQYPAIPHIAVELGSEKRLTHYERRQKVEQLLGGNYYEPVRMMMRVRQEIQPHLERLREKLQQASARIG